MSRPGRCVPPAPSCPPCPPPGSLCDAAAELAAVLARLRADAGELRGRLSGAWCGETAKLQAAPSGLRGMLEDALDLARAAGADVEAALAATGAPPAPCGEACPPCEEPCRPPAPLRPVKARRR